jgi:ABC-2 type transport system permease protein
MNPMIRKELRQRMRERRAWILPTLYLVALGGAVTLAYYFSIEQSFGRIGDERQGAQVGVTVFLTVAFAQMALLLLLAPVFSAGSLTIEKEQRTLAGLLTSLLTSAEIWWGKFVSAMMFVTLLLLSALPVLSLAFSLGGVGPEELVRTTAMTLWILACVSAIGLYFSSIFRRSVHSTAVSYAAVIVLTFVTLVIFTLLQSHWESKMQAQHPDSSKPTPEMPEYMKIPMYLNPFYALFSALSHSHDKFPDWLKSALIFLALGGLAVILALRNIRRGGEQG